MGFQRHVIDRFPGGYQVAVADVNGNGRPDVVALSTMGNRVQWYENPSWQAHPIARTERNIDLALHDVDGDGRLELALASGFYFNDSHRGGSIELLYPPAEPGEVWRRTHIATDPVVHRLRWADVDGDGRAELIHASIFGPGSDAVRSPRPAHLWALRPPAGSDAESSGSPHWQVHKIDETLTVLHGIWVGDLDGDGRAEILTASFDGIRRFDCSGPLPQATWTCQSITAGYQPESPPVGTPRGTSEVTVLRRRGAGWLLAAIEPWHGNQVVVYEPNAHGTWKRHLLDDTLREGHALVAADLDGDGEDEIVAGWRGGEGGLALYDRLPGTAVAYRKTVIDSGITIEGAVAADINGNGRVDLVAIAGRTGLVVWYENTGR